MLYIRGNEEIESETKGKVLVQNQEGGSDRSPEEILSPKTEMPLTPKLMELQSSSLISYGKVASFHFGKKNFLQFQKMFQERKLSYSDRILYKFNLVKQFLRPIIPFSFLGLFTGFILPIYNFLWDPNSVINQLTSAIVNVGYIFIVMAYLIFGYFVTTKKEDNLIKWKDIFVVLLIKCLIIPAIGILYAYIVNVGLSSVLYKDVIFVSYLIFISPPSVLSIFFYIRIRYLFEEY